MNLAQSATITLKRLSKDQKSNSHGNLISLVLKKFLDLRHVEKAKWGAILVNKGINLAKELSSLEMFENQNIWNVMVATQARKLANHLRNIFASSRTLLFWRETYYNHKVSIVIC